MVIVDESGRVDLSFDCEADAVGRSGSVERRTVEIPVEHLAEVSINGSFAFSLTCTPCDMAELVVGRLYTEGLIDSVQDLASLQAPARTDAVSVVIKEDALRRRMSKGDRLVCDASGDAWGSAWDRLRLRARPLSPVPSAVKPLDYAQVFEMAEAFAADMPLHAGTYGVHSCSVYRKGELMCSYEDLGRHNAFDKAIGAALLSGAPMNELAVFSSGRVPYDMAAKAVRCGIPLLVAKATPTTEAVALARRYGLALVGRARPDSFCVFAEGEGLASEMLAEAKGR